MTALLVPEPLAQVDRWLDGPGHCLCLWGPARGRRRLADEACQRAEGRGLAVVARALADCDEQQLAAWVCEDCRRLVAGLGLSRTAAYFAAEMLAVPAGRRTLGTISYEARRALLELGIYDCWTEAEGLAASLRVVGALAQESGQEALLVYGEAQRLQGRQSDGPLAALRDGLLKATAQPGLRVVLTAGPAARRRLEPLGALHCEDVTI